MSKNPAPDSWDEADVADMSASDLQQKLIKLNVNAAEFVPSFGSFSTKTDGENGNDQEPQQTVSGVDKKSASECSIPVLRL